MTTLFREMAAMHAEFMTLAVDDDRMKELAESFRKNDAYLRVLCKSDMNQHRDGLISTFDMLRAMAERMGAKLVPVDVEVPWTPGQ